MPWLKVNHTRLMTAGAVPTPLFALEVQRAGMPGCPGAALRLRSPMQDSIEADRELPRKFDPVAHRSRAFPQAGAAPSSIESSSFSRLEQVVEGASAKPRTIPAAASSWVRQPFFPPAP